MGAPGELGELGSGEKFGPGPRGSEPVPVGMFCAAKVRTPLSFVLRGRPPSAQVHRETVRLNPRVKRGHVTTAQLPAACMRPLSSH